jgi:hypothetical protein
MPINTYNVYKYIEVSAISYSELELRANCSDP